MELTVFTPTYNRKELLAKLYNYLVSERFYDMEWIIVDDGSTDGTEKLVKQLLAEAPFQIRYFYQENSGKYIAFNKAIEEADSNYLVCIDSDDVYTKNAIYELCETAKLLTDDEAGICFLSCNNDGQIIGSEFPKGLKACNLIELNYLYGVKGDKGILHKTQVLKEFRFPVIEGEKFVTETVLYAQISKKYKYRLINQAWEIKNYQKDGLSAKYRSLLINNPKGAIINYKLVDQFKLNINYLVRNTVRLTSFVFYLRESWLTGFKGSSHKAMYVLCTPIGLIVAAQYEKRHVKG